MPRPIPDTDISVVVQGPLFRGRQEGITACLESIRKVLPNAEVVISTWIGEDTGNLAGVDRIVTRPDPGCFVDIYGDAYNINRQIVSTREGVSAASRKYVLKFRADLSLNGTRLFMADPCPDGLFIEKVSIPNIFVRHPERFPMLFHPSDIAQFGLKADIMDFWNCSPFVERDVLNSGIRHFEGYYPDQKKLAPEQAITLQWLKRHGQDVCLSHPRDVSMSNMSRWEAVLVSNFRILDWNKSGIIFPQRMLSPAMHIGSLVTESELAATRNGERCFSWYRYFLSARLKPTIGQVILSLTSIRATLSACERVCYRISPRLHHVLKKNMLMVWRRFRTP